MNELFLNVLRTSLVVGVVTAMLALLAPFWNKTFAAAWKRKLWCVLALTLILGAFFRLPDSVPQVKVAVPQTILVGQRPVTPPLQEVGGEPATVTPISPGETPQPTLVAPQRQPIDLLTLLPWLWVMGAAAFLLWQGIGEATFSRRVRRWGHAAQSTALQGTYHQACAELGPAGPFPTLLICPGIGSPQLRGLVCPKLLLPTEAYTETEAGYILRHELTHWAARDLQWKALILLANALHWFNPAVWLLRREANRDMERACDETVCAGVSGEERKAYGEVLLASLHKGRQTGLSTYFYGGKTIMKDRLVNILSTKNRRRGAGLAVVCGLLTILAVPLIACTQTPESVAAPEDYVRSLRIPLEAEPYTPESLANIAPEVVSPDTVGELLAVHSLPDGTEVICYREKGNKDHPYWALRRDEGITRFTRENTASDHGFSVSDYTDILGHSGFRIECPRDAGYFAVDYYYLDESGLPVLLADCANHVAEQDLNGDGTKELLWAYPERGESYYTFRQAGQVYRADVNALLKKAQPEWTVLGVQPDAMMDLLLPIRYQPGPDAAPRAGAIGFTTEAVEFYEKTETPADEAVSAIAQAYIAKSVADMEQEFEIGEDLSGENFFSTTHVTVLESRQTALECGARLPAKDESGQIEIWSLAYQMKMKNSDKIVLAGGRTLLGDWLTIGPDGDGYVQPVFAVWRGKDGTVTHLDTTNEGGIGESYHGNYELYAGEQLYKRTGLRPETLDFDVYTDPDFTRSAYRLEEGKGLWSLYLPETWVAERNTEYPPEAASTRRCVGLWHDPENPREAVVLYHVDGRADDPDLGLNLLQAGAADAGVGELNFVSEGHGNMDTSGGMVQQYSGKTTENVILRAFAVDDGKGGAWGVLTLCPAGERADWSDLAVSTFLAERPEREALRNAYAQWGKPDYAPAFFTDLTGDKREELVVQTIKDEQGNPLRPRDVTAKTNWTGTLSVLAAADNGTVVTLYEIPMGSAHAGWGEVYLYHHQALRQDCLLEYHPYSSGGTSAFSYALYTVTPYGGREILSENSLEFPASPEARQAAGVSDGTVRVFLSEVDTYLADAQPLMVYDKVLDPFTGDEGELRFALLEGEITNLPQNIWRPAMQE